MSPRAAIPALVALLAAPAVVGTTSAQGLGDAAARQRQEREKKAREGKPAVPTYTNDALPGESARGGEKAKGKGEAGPEASGTPADAAAEAAPGAEASGDEESWRQRADDARRAIAAAEKALADAEARAAQLLQDRDPLAGVNDPSRLQTLEAMRARSREDVEAARKAVAEARQALADLEDEARRKSVPPGWLRER